MEFYLYYFEYLSSILKPTYNVIPKPDYIPPQHALTPNLYADNANITRNFFYAQV